MDSENKKTIKVKIVETYSNENDCYPTDVSPYDLTDWEEVTHEELQILQDWIKSQDWYSAKRHHLLIDRIGVKDKIAEIVEKIRLDQQKRWEDQEKQRAKNAREAAVKAKKKAEREKKQLERLKAKYEESQNAQS